MVFPLLFALYALRDLLSALQNKEISSMFLGVCYFLKVLYTVCVLSWRRNHQVLVSRDMHFPFALVVILVVSETLTPTADGTRIIERFGGSHRSLDPCVILVSKTVMTLEEDTLKRLPSVTRSVSGLFRFFSDYNCTLMQYEAQPDPFGYLPNGTYTSTVGIIQRNKVDTMILFVRPDALPFEPGLIGPVMFAADACITSARMSSRVQLIQRTLTVFISDFGVINYCYVFICIFVFGVLFLLLEHSNLSVRERLSISRICKLTERIGYSLVDQELIEATKTHSRILLLAFNVFLFFMLYGLFLCNIGANLVTLSVPHEIEGPEELLRNGSDVAKMAVYGETTVPRVLELEDRYRPDSLMAQVKRKIWSNPDGIRSMKKILENPHVTMMTNTKLLNDLRSNKRALLVEEVVIRRFQKINCVLQPSVAALVRSTKETFAPGFLAMIYSHRINGLVRKVFDYYFKVIGEGMLLYSFLEALQEDLPSFFSAQVTVESIQCELGVNETLRDAKMGWGSWRKFEDHDYLPLFIGMGYTFLVSFFVLIIEIVVHSLGRVFRKKQRTTKRTTLRPATSTAHKRLEVKLTRPVSCHV